MVGLFIHPEQPWLSCSPDGILDSDGRMCLVKIKCPFSLKDKKLLDHEHEESFVPYIHYVNGQLRLKKTHQYYSQTIMPYILAKDEAKAAFVRRGAIPGVLACIDSTLIAIMNPEGLSPADTASFISRKGYYALNVMVVCNAELRILVVDPRFPGSCHDSWLWQHNPLRARLAAQLQPGEYLLDRAARIIYACVALHNIALDAGDWSLDDYGGEVPPAEEPGDSQVLAPHDVFLRGRQQCSAIVNLF
ncbi:hypothetical protein HPB49_007984 [Dermacentor silvarum]|uniref:Uncharacterized protein n=1 Tax=Dermacentor silvarum TaxID=543639 RepID=A0ACB8C8C7_DERSI|nr:hypothetical protein HPB49_007984 [Dermacentor silvarum]